ncbi:uncharacterized protein LOC104452023 [Eucalyptus grandis]|uniref:uncharacterized protein LOC104452023 n=1 Tax=Eucalyptus grandis TaxID=71139 RepID=UPI00192EF3E7|nr:uncharacterized protein LOC104452023 [Eucalyptus grandis]
MDAGDDESSPSLKLDELVPPRLEDAGLEDCALPLESIQLAFLKAAAAAAADDDDDADDDADGSDAPGGDDRLDGPRPYANGDSGVVAAGALSEPDGPADDAAGPCSRGDGGELEARVDEAEGSPVQEMQKLEIGKSVSDLKSSR